MPINLTKLKLIIDTENNQATVTYEGMNYVHDFHWDNFGNIKVTAKPCLNLRDGSTILDLEDSSDNLFWPLLISSLDRKIEMLKTSDDKDDGDNVPLSPKQIQIIKSANGFVQKIMELILQYSITDLGNSSEYVSANLMFIKSQTALAQYHSLLKDTSNSSKALISDLDDLAEKLDEILAKVEEKDVDQEQLESQAQSEISSFYEMHGKQLAGIGADKTDIIFLMSFHRAEQFYKEDPIGHEKWIEGLLSEALRAHNECEQAMDI